MLFPLHEGCGQTGESFETCTELAQRRIYIHSHWDGFLILLVVFALGCGMFSEVLAMYRGICTSVFLTTLKQTVGNQGIWIS